MRTAEDRHLTPDEIVGRVFPGDDRPSPVPEHLAGCEACQSKVARLREAWLLDRGAVDGFVDGLPESFWEAERAAVLAAVEGHAVPERPVTSGILPFPAAVRRGRLLRHPFLALGSVAAAVALVAALSVGRPGSREVPAPAPQAMATPVTTGVPPMDQADDELLLSIERLLHDEPVYATLVPDETT
jgi:anti-sigma factor RsiW